MKKIILTLGLGALITMPNLLASDSITTEPLADQPLTVENRLKGFYIKPFVGGWFLSGTESNGVNRTEVSIHPVLLKGYDGLACYAMQTKGGSVYGIAVGTHLNEYIDIENSIGYYSTDSLQLLFIENENGYKGQNPNSILDIKKLGIINAILSPVINASITENIWLYLTAGIGGSYMMFGNNIETSLSAFSSVEQEFKHYNAQKLHLSVAVGAGVRIRFMESTELDIGYSYKYLGSIPTSSGYQAFAKAFDPNASSRKLMDLLVHEVLIGLKFNF